MEFETFYDKIKESNGVLMVTIPQRVWGYAGMKKGDPVKVMIKKQEVE